MVNWILLSSSLLGVLAATFMFYSSLGMFYDREKGRPFCLTKTEPGDKITRWDLFKATFEKNRAGFAGFVFLWFAFVLQLVIILIDS